VPTLFCDLSGVVFTDPPQRCVEQWQAANGGRLGIRTMAELRDDVLAGFETGRVGEPEYLSHLRDRLGWTGPDAELIRIWTSARPAVALDVLAVLTALRERGWQLIAASVADPWRERALAEDFGWVMSLFDRVVRSTDLGARGTDPRFFAELTRGVPRHGPRIYVGDDPQLVSAARRSGLDGHLFADAAGLKAACTSLVLASS